MPEQQAAQKTNRLGEEKIPKLLMQFSLPAIVGMLVNSIYNVVDRIFIGNSPEAGMLGLAGLTAAFPLMMIALALATLFSVGGATLFATRLGEKRPDEAARVLGNVALMLTASFTLLSIIGLAFLDPLLRLFGASEEILPFARDYLQIILIATPIQGIAFGGNHLARADGSPIVSMMSSVIGCAFNIVFDPILIYGFHMGVKGAALATIGGMLVSTVWMCAYFTGKRCTIRFRFKYMTPHWPTIKRVCQIGMPNFCMQFAGSILTGTFNNTIMYYGNLAPVTGNTALSVFGALNSIQTLIVMPTVGIVQGQTPIIGYNTGAKRPERALETWKWACIAATAWGILGFALTHLFPEALMRMFGSEPTFLEFGVVAIKIWFLSLPLIGFQMVTASYFQGIGQSLKSTLLTLSRQVLFVLPMIFILPTLFGLNGVLYVPPCSDVLAVAVTAFFMWREHARHKNEHIPAIEKV